jgi:hypothetical protein
MKKTLLLFLVTLYCMNISAQYMLHNDQRTLNSGKRIPFVGAVAPQAVSPYLHHAAARTTAVTFATENFGSGGPGTLPTGWTAGSLAGPGTWHWTTVASTSTYSMGAMHSTTAANGWMIFDSDSIGAVCGTCSPSGFLQSPAYNCSGHPSVKLSFENFYRSFNDSCSVWVSTSPTFTTHTDFPVLLNDGLSTNTSTANPSTVQINISSVAAGQPAVYIRFVYYGYAGGSYSWMVDDMSLSELDPHDIAVSGSFLYEPEASAYDGSIFNTPLQFVDSVYPVTLLTNYGANAETSVPVTANIYQGSSSVYSHTSTYASLALSAFDSVVQFPGYKPNAIGSYMCTIGAALTGDASLANNVDTVLFNVTDTIWQENSGSFTGSYYIHNATGTGAPGSYYNGTRFDVPSSSVGDTVSGFGVAFSATSVPTNTGGKVSVQLYSIQKGGSGWSYLGSSVARPVTAADISASTSSVIWADFRIDQSGGITPFVLQPGTTYAAIVQGNGLTTDLLLYSTAAPNATGYAGYFGQGDTSVNDGSGNFGAITTATGNASAVPMVRMYTGPVTIPVSHVGVQSVPGGDNIGKPYPNPASSEVCIPFTLASDAIVNVTLSDVLGRVVAAGTVNARGGQSAKATFATNNLPGGVYVYTVELNGGHTTGRMIIAH